jgi:hypothetical protein
MQLKRPNRKRASYGLEMYRQVKRRLADGELQHDIAADLGWHQGRISQVKTGKRGSSPSQRSLL